MDAQTHIQAQDWTQKPKYILFMGKKHTITQKNKPTNPPKKPTQTKNHHTPYKTFIQITKFLDNNGEEILCIMLGVRKKTEKHKQISLGNTTLPFL